MPVEIIYETHQTSTDNEAGIATGWLPGELSALGRAQALELAERRRHDDLGAVFTSDLRRAVETAEITFGTSTVPIIQDTRLRECNYGELNGAPVTRIEVERPNRITKPYPGGQSYEDVLQNMDAFLSDLATKWDGSRVLLIAHSANLWALQVLLGGANLADLVAAPFDWQPGWFFTLSPHQAVANLDGVHSQRRRQVTKFAVITDAHANLPALEAALAAIGDLGCEAIYHTGDAVGIGPFRNEVLDRLLHTPGMHFVMGNHDELCALGLPDPPPDWLHDEHVANMRWTQEHVDPELQRMMAAWPHEIVETMSSRLFSFLHYPRDPEGSGFVPIIADPSVAELDALFGQQQADVIFYGHHHPAADHYGRARYINAGSLGCSREELAHYTVVDVSQSGSLNFEHHAVAYDGSALLEAMELRDVPDRELICKMFFPRASSVF